MDGDVSIRYLNLVGVEKGDLVFSSDSVGDQSAIEYRKSTTREPTQEKVTRLDYRDCMGLIRLIVDFIVALFKKCFGCFAEEELPQKTYDLSKFQVRFREERLRNAREAECGIENATLIDQIFTAVREVDSSFTKRSAIEISEKVATAWGKYKKMIAEERVVISDVHGEPLDASLKRGFCRPAVFLVRSDENRNDKLFQSRLQIIVPIREGGKFEKEVTLYSGIVAGADNPSPRELAAMASSNEGIILELGNNPRAQEGIIKSVVEKNREELVRAVIEVLAFIDTNLFPSEGQIILTIPKGNEKVVLKARSLVFAQSSEGDDRAIQSKKEKIENLIEGAIKKGASETLNIGSLVRRSSHDTKWEVEFTLTPHKKF